MWPSELSHIYAMLSPITFADWSGYGVFVNECKCARCDGPKAGPSLPQHPPVIKERTRAACDEIAKCRRNPVCFKKWADCIDSLPGYAGWSGARTISCMYEHCMGKTRHVHIDCNVGFQCSLADACAVTGPGHTPCKIQICATRTSELCSYTVCTPFDPMAEPWYMPNYAICDEPACDGLIATIIHEMSHCCGMPASPDHGNDVYDCLAGIMVR